ncbi:YTDC2 helicase, partial [Polypterus senegalus]
MSRPSSVSPRPTPAQSGQSTSRAKGLKDIRIDEEVEIALSIALERFRYSDEKEMEFPSSFTSIERAYIHRLAPSLGLISKSKGFHSFSLTIPLRMAFHVEYFALSQEGLLLLLWRKELQLKEEKKLDRLLDIKFGWKAVQGKLYEVKELFLEDILRSTGYANKEMIKYKKDKQKEEKQHASLNEWCKFRDRSPKVEQRKEKVASRPLEEKDFLDDGLDSVFCHLSEKDVNTLEPWLLNEMDACISDIFLNQDAEAFVKLFNLILSENVSVDYRHRETSATPLMVAAGRGFISQVEQLLSMGANVHLKASNGWTALDWARHFNQAEIVDLLESSLSSLEAENLDESILVQSNSGDLNAEDRELLKMYHHSFDDEKVDLDLIMHLLYNICQNSDDGAVLIFLPGYDEIVGLRDRILYDDKRFSDHIHRYQVFTLHSNMQTSDQKRVLRVSPPGIRKIILSTNIAETSITVNDVVFVIDSGKVKEKSFDALNHVTMLKMVWISKASAIQRKGRAGRCRPGICFHLFSRLRFKNMLEFPIPELLRMPLQTIDAMDFWEDLTELGYHLADLPVEPHLGKMVLCAVVLKCLDPILTIACTLAYRDPFVLPVQAAQKRAAMLCRKRFVRARGGGDIRDVNLNSENWAVVKAALVAGIYPNLIHVDKENFKLVGAKEKKVRIHPTSVLSQPNFKKIPPENGQATAIQSLPTDWLIYDEMIRSHRIASIRCCSVVTPFTVAIFGGTAKLPSTALQEPIVQRVDGTNDSSDSEMEERSSSNLATLKIDEWMHFKLEQETANLTFQLRQKWHSLFLRRIRAPSKPWSQVDEATMRALVSALTTEEHVTGLQQPTGIGQRPRPMSSEEPPQLSSWRATNSRKSSVDNEFVDETSNTERSQTMSPSSAFYLPKAYKDRSGVHPKRILDDKSDQSSVKSTDSNSFPSPCASPSPPSSGKGYARMCSEISQERSQEWGSTGLGGVFKVEWIRKESLPFQHTHQLLNPWNDNKKVQISRDGQVSEIHTNYNEK